MALKKENNMYSTNGGRVVFVVNNGETIEKARDACYNDVTTIKSDGLFYRTDIGL
jgi:phosphoribosylamine--glycine ligase